MSILTTTSTNIDGLVLGQGAVGPFRPHDYNSSFARYERDGVSCGVLFVRPDEDDPSIGYLRISPAYQLPRGARRLMSWKRFIFLLDDDDSPRLHLDPDDGEVRLDFIDDHLATPAQVEAAIDRYVGLCASTFSEVLGYVGGQMDAAVPGC